MSLVFPHSEHAARCARLQAMMAQRGIDVVLFTAPAEQFYYSGFFTPFWQSPTRPWYLLVARTGKPIAVIPSIGAALYEQCFVDSVHTWESPHPSDEGVSLLAKTILQCPLPNGTFGMMQSKQSYCRMTLADYTALLQALPNINMVDCSDVIHAQRQIKSASEIEKIATACECVSEVFDTLPNWLTASLLSQGAAAIHKAFKIRCLQAGVDDVAYLVGGVGYDDVISLPTTAAPAAGDILMLDTGCTVSGYYCDFDRNYAIGHCSDAARRAYDTLWRATEAGMHAARAGSTCAQVFNEMAAVIKADGYMAGDSHASVGRYGHGLGIELTETPSLCAWDNTLLQSDMVMTLEPSLEYEDDGKKLTMVHEENIVITAAEAAPRCLTRRAPRECPII